MHLQSPKVRVADHVILLNYPERWSISWKSDSLAYRLEDYIGVPVTLHAAGSCSMPGDTVRLS